MQNLGQILFVMWRETVEAMLVVGILHAWLSHDANGLRGKKYLWLGVFAGLALALVLGLGIEAMSSVLSDDGQEYFRVAMLLVAATLIVQMVFWMRRNGRRLKQDMEYSLSRSAETQHWWGVFSLAAIAVAREGSETVVFLSSLAMGENGFASPQFWLAFVLGVALAGVTFYLLQLGGQLFSWRIFFQVTEILLLLLGCSLLMSGAEKLMDMQLIPTLKTQVWDSSIFLDDGSIFGGIVSSFTGYRSKPALMSLFVFASYWLFIWGMVTLPRSINRK
jgi:high-affinity iron transporter